jgi:hypothetical protein
VSPDEGTNFIGNSNVSNITINSIQFTQAKRDRETEGERQRDRETERQRDRETER